jgi:hypothetical protein
MADENKAEDSRKMPIPLPATTDHEDVSWALSTAEATWKRGERADALKWLRRAAEAASEAEDDDRALALAKAAAELASDLDGPKPPPAAQIKPPQQMFTPSRPPPVPPSRPAPPPAPPSRPAPPPPMMTMNQMSPMMSKPSHVEAPDARRSRPPPLISKPVAPVAPQIKPAAPQVASPNASRPDASRPEAARPDAMKPKAPVAVQRPAFQGSSRGAVMAPQAPKSEPTAQKEADKTKPLPAAPVTSPDMERAARLAAAAKAQGTDNTDATQMMEYPPREEPRSPETPDANWSITPSVDDMDSWPTAAFAGDPATYDEPNRTRHGTPAYTERAKVVSGAKSAPPAPLVKPSQAVRVIVWRGADGVHVAPHGTTVSAISVDAMLVALDPSADLSAWLSNK